MNKYFLYFVIFLLFAITATGQLSANDANTIKIPPERQYDTGFCFQKQVSMLYNATNVNDPLQESYLKAAEAYKLLDESGQKCD